MAKPSEKRALGMPDEGNSLRADLGMDIGNSLLFLEISRGEAVKTRPDEGGA
jgi:hypothetical protein